MGRPNPFRRVTAALRGFGFKQWFLLILNIVLLLAMAASLAGVRVMSTTLDALTAAERFGGGGEVRFAQLACYLPVDQGKTEEEINTFRQTLSAKLVEQSLDAPENGSLTIDAYSASASLTVRSDGGGSATLKAVGVGGDFFFFHPLFLRSGAYIRDGDLMDDLVVLDEETAWRLFGGTELTGLTIYVNDEPFVVAGVISREDDFASKRAYSGDGGLFLSYSALSRLVEETAITSYELVMPDPISGYAKGVVTDAFPIGNGDVVENSSRYSLPHLLEVIGGFGERSMRTNGVIYPYWENAARLTEDYAALLLVLSVLFALCPLLFALAGALRSIRRAYRYVKATVPEKVDAAVEKRKEERLERQYEKKAKGE